MTVNWPATRAALAKEITVVGNLIGDATVSVVPRGSRLQDLSVRLGDRVSRGMRIAKIEDFEIVEQVKQAESGAGGLDRNDSSARSRPAACRDQRRTLTQPLRASTAPKQTLDDNEARYQAALASSISHARRTCSRSSSRRTAHQPSEYRDHLAGERLRLAPRSTRVRTCRRTPVVDVVDITRVRLVANIVEKDLEELEAGNELRVQVDAYPGETFKGRIARVSLFSIRQRAPRRSRSRFRTATSALKPGMYARVGITTERRSRRLSRRPVPSSISVVDAVCSSCRTRRRFSKPSRSDLEQGLVVEILAGLAEGDEVISTGAERCVTAIASRSAAALAAGRGRRGGEANGTESGGTAPDRAVARTRRRLARVVTPPQGAPASGTGQERFAAVKPTSVAKANGRGRPVAAKVAAPAATAARQGGDPAVRRCISLRTAAEPEPAIGRPFGLLQHGGLI